MASDELTPFEQLVVEALDELPPAFARYLENVEVLVAARPTREQRRALGLKPWHTLYGLYEGVPLTERTGGALVLPDVITLFQSPLERDFPSRAGLKREVRRTVFHEIAHVFGISDDRLRELDAY
ncbi:MAG: metallopeptidase family protein [Chloroflexales bacterium]|nr:metallopeptidase family protein [Chloroflexales bacterium]